MLHVLCTFFQLLQLLEIRIKETYPQFMQDLFYMGYLKLLYFFQNYVIEKRNYFMLFDL